METAPCVMMIRVLWYCLLLWTDHDSSSEHRYLVLRPEVRARCTVTSEDSSSDEAELGTLDHCAHVILRMLQRCPDNATRRHLAEAFLQLSSPTKVDALATIDRTARYRCLLL